MPLMAGQMLIYLITSEKRKYLQTFFLNDIIANRSVPNLLILDFL